MDINRISDFTGVSVKELNRLKNTRWFHGTTTAARENIQKEGVIATYNLGTELDFGTGFYLTDSYENAEKYISRLPYVDENGRLRGRDEWEVIEFEFSPFDLLFGKANNYRCINFPKYNEEFAKFVLDNRIYNVYNEKPHGYDIIWGVMSDSVPEQITYDVRNGLITYEDAIVRLQKNTSMKQLYIGTQEICDMLLFKTYKKGKREV